MPGEGSAGGGGLIPYGRALHRLRQGFAWAAGVLRAACWSWWTLRRLRRSLPVDGLRAEVPAPPRLPSGAGPGVLLGLRRASPTCLERALILQRWLAAHGAGRDVVIGVQAGGERLGAHAWIDGDEPESVAEYTELHRVPPP